MNKRLEKHVNRLSYDELEIYYSNLTDDDIERNIDIYDWKHISKWCNMSHDFIYEHRYNIYFHYYFVYNKNAHVSIMESCNDRIFFSDIARLLYITEFTYETRHVLKNYPFLFISDKVTDSFILEHENEIDWTTFSQYGYITIDFINRWEHKLNWEHISRNENIMLNNTLLDPTFCEKYADKLNWNLVIHTLFNDDIYMRGLNTGRIFNIDYYIGIKIVKRNIQHIDLNVLEHYLTNHDDILDKLHTMQLNSRFQQLLALGGTNK